MTIQKQPADIIWTYTDEAPALATHSLFPMVESILKQADINVQMCDISLAARILEAFPEHLSESQRIGFGLKELGALVEHQHANIIKLPNISASDVQLKAAITELQSQGYQLPDYPESPKNETESEVQARYNQVKGSAVNPVLREGNSDRRVAASVKQYAKNHPPKLGAWSPDSQAHVASMSSGDFFDTEQAKTIGKPTKLTITLIDSENNTHLLKDNIHIGLGDIVDCASLSVASLKEFYQTETKLAKKNNLLLSLHLKATMMKVSDPILFGHAVRELFSPLFDKYQELFNELGIEPKLGLMDLFEKIKTLPDDLQDDICQLYEQTLETLPALAMVNSDHGITNLHRSNDVIIDASMPAMIRDSGKMWNAQGELESTKALIPDRSYSAVYQTVMNDCKKHGAFDPSTMGSVANVGLMAKKAQEYGSHDKTFEIQQDGVVRVTDSDERVLFEHQVTKGDIWRMCLVKDVAVKDWVRLAVERAQLSKTSAIFWLDEQRAHDRELIKKVNQYLAELNTSKADLQVASVKEATQVTLNKIRRGENVIAVTGNVLRDYLTDLFPILELGTSAKMLSIVPLLNGGGLFETGAGGSAPKHVQQFEKEGYLRWDSLGEFLALTVSLEHLARTQNKQKANVLASTLDQAVTKFLEENKSPTRRLGGIDNRGSHFYLILYWTQCLALQQDDAELASKFSKLSQDLMQQCELIEQELVSAQRRSEDLGGYYHTDRQKVSNSMRPSITLKQAFAD